MEHACTSPGSRNAPIVISLVREPRIRCWSHIDERCAGFFAVGRGQGQRPPGRRHVHLGDGGGEPRPGRDRGVSGAATADRADRRSARRTARRRRRPGDRSAQALRRRGQVVLSRSSAARRVDRGAAVDPPARLPGVLDRRRGAARPGASQPAAARAARARRATRGRSAARAVPTAPPGWADPPPAIAASRARSRGRGRASSSRAGSRSGGASRRTGVQDAAAAARLAERAAGRCSPTRCRAPATATTRSRPTTCCCATADSRRGRARARRPRRRPADLQAAARLAGVAGATSASSRSIPTRPGRIPTRSSPRSTSGPRRRARRIGSPVAAIRTGSRDWRAADDARRARADRRASATSCPSRSSPLASATGSLPR